MSNIKYVTGDLFELAPKDAYLAHAVNCQGVWGSGIAVQFRKKYPSAYKMYVDMCLEFGSHNAGHGDVFGKVVCLYTSRDYGSKKDTKKRILDYTRVSLNMITLENPEVKELHMPKINSGLFGVPWEETEAILKELDGKLSFVVYESEKK